MTSVERKKELGVLHKEFYTEDTTDTRRVEILLKVQSFAAEEMPESKCRYCGKPGIAVEYDYALVEGHCYSPEGMQDYQSITKVCEYCFDKACGHLDPDDTSIPKVGPRDTGDRLHTEPPSKQGFTRPGLYDSLYDPNRRREDGGEL